MLQAIIFDFDGVVVDSEPAHFAAFLAVMRPLGYTFDYDDYQRDIIGYDDRDALHFMLTQKLGRTPGSAMQNEIQQLMAKKQQAFLDHVKSKPMSMIPGVDALIDQAKQTLPIAIASGATAADIDAILQGLGRSNDFPIIVTADDVAKSKPDPASYRLAVQRLSEHVVEQGGQPFLTSSCLAIEDSPAGLKSAKAAGLRTLGLTTTHPREDLAMAQRVVEDLQNLDLQLLQQWYVD